MIGACVSLYHGALQAMAILFGSRFALTADACKRSTLLHFAGRSCAYKALIWPRPGRLPERRPSDIFGAIINRCSLTSQAAWNIFSRCAGACGGARVGCVPGRMPRRSGHDHRAQLGVRGEYAVEADQIQARTRHQCRESLHEFQRRFHRTHGRLR